MPSTLIAEDIIRRLSRCLRALPDDALAQRWVRVNHYRNATLAEIDAFDTHTLRVERLRREAFACISIRRAA